MSSTKHPSGDTPLTDIRQSAKRLKMSVSGIRHRINTGAVEPVWRRVHTKAGVRRKRFLTPAHLRTLRHRNQRPKSADALTYAQTAKLLGRDVETVRRYVSAGLLEKCEPAEGSLRPGPRSPRVFLSKKSALKLRRRLERRQLRASAARMTYGQACRVLDCSISELFRLIRDGFLAKVEVHGINKKGRRCMKRFVTRASVKELRSHRAIAAKIPPGKITVREAAKRLGVTVQAVYAAGDRLGLDRSRRPALVDARSVDQWGHARGASGATLAPAAASDNGRQAEAERATEPLECRPDEYRRDPNIYNMHLKSVDPEAAEEFVRANRRLAGDSDAQAVHAQDAATAKRALPEPEEKEPANTREAVLEYVRLCKTPRTGAVIAKRLGYPFNSHFRNVLSRLVKAGELVKAQGGGYMARAQA